jgi:hypothetical protein
MFFVCTSVEETEEVEAVVVEVLAGVLLGPEAVDCGAGVDVPVVVVADVVVVVPLAKLVYAPRWTEGLKVTA